MANSTITSTNSTLVSAIGGARSLLVQNLGPGNLYFDTSTDANATVTASSGLLISVNATMPVDLYQAHMRCISNSTADVRFCG